MIDNSKNKIATIRQFNRYYTNVLGLLDKHILESELSLSEARVLHEIAATDGCTSKMLIDMLCIDSGYLSRVLDRLEKCGFINKAKSPSDKRAHLLSLTSKGFNKMAALNGHSDKQIQEMISGLSEEETSVLANSMLNIRNTLTHQRPRPEDVTIRHDLRPGDAGCIIAMHARIYRAEYDYCTSFEGYVAQSFCEFLLNYNPERDRLWVAEHLGAPVGCIGVVNHGSRAQLRWFLLSSEYRGIGLGKKLMNMALDFCRQCGYDSVFLDTTSDLPLAISMYTKAGFVKISEKDNNVWREGVTELEFELKL
ncbi:MAG: helix-turn-helix domain-containing GNAT family N-acetyltransferase [Clostridiaceae bacterium]|nr:helix-turn-helix domain-containing GNAT family N-acetyltransferase [Clostridiaceae bacterium]